MCQLLGMSANTPTDIRFSFAGLRLRGGKVGPHRDGFGLGLYRDQGLSCYHDPKPASESHLAQLLEQLPLKADIAIGHIRQANVGEVNLANTHPFVREWQGRLWCFAHNGQLNIKQPLAQGHYQAQGSTDSEQAFCWLLSRLRAKPPGYRQEQLYESILAACQQLAQRGVFNMMLSDGQTLYAYCHSRLHWLTRQAPFGQAQLVDRDLMVDFAAQTTPADVVTMIATEPLTLNENWQAMEPGQLQVWQQGRCLWSNL